MEGLRGWMEAGRSGSGWRDGFSEPNRTEPQEEPQRTVRTETESKPIRETETKRGFTVVMSIYLSFYLSIYICI